MDSLLILLVLTFLKRQVCIGRQHGKATPCARKELLELKVVIVLNVSSLAQTNTLIKQNKQKIRKKTWFGHCIHVEVSCCLLVVPELRNSVGPVTPHWWASPLHSQHLSGAARKAPSGFWKTVLYIVLFCPLPAEETVPAPL